MVLFSKFLFSTLLAVASVVSAATSVNPISAPASGAILTAGKAFLVEWTASNNHTVSLFLRQGDSDNLQSVLTIITKLPNTGIVRWTPPTHVYTGYNYVIVIEDDSTGDVNYSGTFTINGQAPQSSTSSSVASSTVQSTTSSSSASSSSVLSTTFSSTTATPFVWRNSSAVVNSSTASSSAASSLASSVTLTSSSASSSGTLVVAPNSGSKLDSANTVALLGSLVLGLMALA
ncbi:Ser-Thr-rich glycosyl-phosphatidyl-inositol-anchored membrane family-domain-containing protein [Lipomyces japonicus]|uniref:Ser-Thr-rich glycosyl-phosphatidyl-inositol-anchored membrane family-domain-containing protein n=1 Tax=Lipomyces japonicus TaxID=56871 RepID=UPI0034CFE84A